MPVIPKAESPTRVLIEPGIQDWTKSSTWMCPVVEYLKFEKPYLLLLITGKANAIISTQQGARGKSHEALVHPEQGHKRICISVPQLNLQRSVYLIAGETLAWREHSTVRCHLSKRSCLYSSYHYIFATSAQVLSRTAPRIETKTHLFSDRC